MVDMIAKLTRRQSRPPRGQVGDLCIEGSEGDSRGAYEVKGAARGLHFLALSGAGKLGSGAGSLMERRNPPFFPFPFPEALLF